MSSDCRSSEWAEQGLGWQPSVSWLESGVFQSGPKGGEARIPGARGLVLTAHRLQSPGTLERRLRTPKNTFSGECLLTGKD